MIQEAFFGFLNRPFQAAAQDDSFVPLEPMAETIEQLTDAARKGDGIGVLTAVPGAGKTVVCRELKSQLEDDFVTVLLSSCSFPTRRAMLQAILYEMGCDYSGLTEQEARLKLLMVAQAALPERSGVVLIADEAHQLSPRLLEELRCLTNHIEQGEPLIRVILSGQLLLEERLTLPELQALNYRITCHATLEPFTLKESADYLNGRLTHAGRTAGTLFTSDALEIICRVSDGSPRCLNQIADACLSHAADAGVTPVTDDVVRIVLQDLKQLPLQWNESVCDQLAEGDHDQFDADDAESNFVTGELDLAQESTSDSPVDRSELHFNEQQVEPSWSSDVAAIEVGAGEVEATGFSASECESTESGDHEECVSAVIEVGAEPTIELVDTAEVIAVDSSDDDQIQAINAEAPSVPNWTDDSTQGSGLQELPVDDRYAALDRACEGQETNETGRVEPISVDWKEGGHSLGKIELDSRQPSNERPSLHFPDDDLPTDERIDRVIQVLSDAVASEISRDRPAMCFPSDDVDLVDAEQKGSSTTPSLAVQTAADHRPDSALPAEEAVTREISDITRETSDILTSEDSDRVPGEAASWRATPDSMGFDIVEPESDEIPTDANIDIEDLVEDITTRTLSLMDGPELDVVEEPATTVPNQVTGARVSVEIDPDRPAERPYARLFSRIRRSRTRA